MAHIESTQFYNTKCGATEVSAMRVMRAEGDEEGHQSRTRIEVRRQQETKPKQQTTGSEQIQPEKTRPLQKQQKTKTQAPRIGLGVSLWKNTVSIPTNFAVKPSNRPQR
ncbi:hypothetical protein METBIDRAFT_9728 [Metschnikowia bicuspidata var. bicuspidata NRRL YB-4993]|uniref:Uncharacterized protein n=1 Tax=Metschnikowia bicuspidata var. bicuspidata NRRL YB-4993 TaxID=869754 RepID=A0A1A0HHI3_9ASCO|nr:hypothetical protein METBIDRAFT_9728 [Metschnikowia bicuspidata var. bicuspidata NRRL YB-4993]OBA23466.1 hypothetical protein METBIDRAFT_9728 [Metschnikowia bicuspidata var. bicuspidata NRRL YB-4993]